MKGSISIVTPSLNQGEFLRNCIESVIKQNVDDTQYIIIDGGSTDNSLEIIQANGPAIDYWVHEKDAGQTHAINKGWKKSQGTYFNWLNSDDILVPGALEKVKSVFEENDADVVCGFSTLKWQDGRTEIKRTTKMSSDFSKFVALGWIMQPSTFWKKEVINDFFPLPTDLHFMMDHYLWLQYICRYGTERIKYIEDILAEVSIHPQAKSVIAIDSFDLEREWLYNDLFSSYKEESQEFRISRFTTSNDQIKEFLSEIDFHLSYDRIFKRDEFGRKKGIRRDQLQKSMKNYPVKTLKQGIRNLIRS